MDPGKTLTVERVEHYLSITRKAREKATPLVEEGSPESEMLNTLLSMADDYSSDAQYFLKQGDFIRAFGAISVPICLRHLPGTRQTRSPYGPSGRPQRREQ